MITADQLRTIMPNAGKRADLHAGFLSSAAIRFGIDTRLRLAAWLANIAEETDELRALVESFNYKQPERLLKIFPRDFKDLADAKAVHARGQQAIANRVYANQNGNGDEASGDGWKYRGRSDIQTTGKRNYVAVMLALDLDLLEHPELLEQPEHAANAAGFYWNTHQINKHADRGDIVAARKAVNGGKIGLVEVQEYYRRGLVAFPTKEA
jgi:putative chitinase